MYPLFLTLFKLPKKPKRSENLKSISKNSKQNKNPGDSSGSDSDQDKSSKDKPKKSKKKKNSKSGEKNSKKSKKSSSSKNPEDDSGESKESGEISESESDSDMFDELETAILKRERGEGVWSHIFTGLNSHDLETLQATMDIFGEIDKPIYDVIVSGGGVILALNKSVKSLAKKWGLLEGSFDKRKKKVEKNERKRIENMLKATLSFLEEWQEDFSPNSYSKSAISSVISRYEEPTTRVLVGSRTAKEICTKLKGLLKTNHKLQHVSWSKLGNWEVTPRGFTGQNSGQNRKKKNFYGSGFSYGGGYGGGYGSGFGGYGYGAGYGGYGAGYGGYNNYGPSGSGNGGGNKNKNNAGKDSSTRF